MVAIGGPLSLLPPHPTGPNVAVLAALSIVIPLTHPALYRLQVIVPALLDNDWERR